VSSAPTPNSCDVDPRATLIAASASALKSTSTSGIELLDNGVSTVCVPYAKPEVRSVYSEMSLNPLLDVEFSAANVDASIS
jgi:hypothetical protein